MKKYLFIIKTEVMSNLQYISNILLGFISYILILYVLFNLYSYIYQDTSNVINGYTVNQMIWYVIITELIWKIDGGRRHCNEISEDVKSGSITYKINKPYSYIGYSLSKHIGDIIVRGVIYFISSMLIGFIFTHSLPNFSILEFIIACFSILLSLITCSFFTIFIGLFSFYIEDSGPFYWLYGKFILILGTLFPIEYFPTFLQGFLSYSPIYAICYGPAKLFVDYANSNVLSIILSQIIYIIIGYLLCIILYKKGVKKINVNGG